MKKMKKMWGKLRDKTVEPIADLMIEYPNTALIFIIADVLLTLMVLFSGGSDVPLNLNE